MISADEYYTKKQQPIPSDFSMIQFLKSGKWEIQIENERFPIQVSGKPLYDPSSSRIKC